MLLNTRGCTTCCCSRQAFLCSCQSAASCDLPACVSRTCACSSEPLVLTVLVPTQRRRCWAMCAIWATLAKLPMCGLVEWCCSPCSSAGTPFKLGPGTHPTPADSNKHVRSSSLNAFRLEMLCKFFSLLSCISPQFWPAQFQVAN